jgi:uncharacterized repeat protein (TIGR03803 family)
VLYSFSGGTDGSFPTANLINVNGMLYGTTSFGGGYYGCGNSNGCGTVFSIDPKSGTEAVLHSFGSGSDGGSPVAGLINVNGMLYGTTASGGAQRHGTVFSISNLLLFHRQN